MSAAASALVCASSVDFPSCGVSAGWAVLLDECAPSMPGEGKAVAVETPEGAGLRRVGGSGVCAMTRPRTAPSKASVLWRAAYVTAAEKSVETLSAAERKPSVDSWASARFTSRASAMVTHTGEAVWFGPVARRRSMNC